MSKQSKLNKLNPKESDSLIESLPQSIKQFPIIQDEDFHKENADKQRNISSMVYDSISKLASDKWFDTFMDNE